MLSILKSAIVDACLLLWYRIRRTSLYITIVNRLFIAVPAVMLLFTSCLKDDLDFDKIKSPGWQPGVAVPLAQTTMTILELMQNEHESGLIDIDSTNLCTLVYEARALSLDAAGLINLPQQGDNHSVSVPGPVATLINNTGFAAFSHTTTIGFATNGGAELDSVFYKNGNIVLQVNSRLRADVQLTITVPGATLDGVPFSATIPLNYTGSIPVSDEVNIDLAQYKMDLTDGGIAHNTLRVDYDVEVTSTGPTIQAGDRINFIFGIYTTDYSKLFGYFGQQQFLSTLDTLQISVFNALQQAGALSIAEPEINVNFTNSIGVPIDASVVSMTGINSTLTTFTPVTGFPNPLPVPSPGIQQIGQSVTGGLTLDNGNSNVVTLIQGQPNYLVSQVEGSINPAGPDYENFITDSSRLDVDVEVILPLYGSVNDFILSDTLDFTYANLQNVNELLIRTHLINGFPFEASWQVYFTDDQYNKLDSLVLTNALLMPSGIINGAGLVTAPSVNTVDNTFDRARILGIMPASHVIVQARISTANGGQTNVKIYADYEFTVHLGAIAKVIL